MWVIALILSGLLLEARYHSALRNELMRVQPREDPIEQEGLLLRLGEWYKVKVILNGDIGTIHSVIRVPYAVP